jgi:SpoVK/Ycf46/Vps4 family AAA+-type ATPase
VRKGRLDEVFFVDLPEAPVREQIFRIHLAKRGLEPGDFDLATLAEAADGFTGAEIEEAIVSARYLASSRDASGAETPVTDADVLAAVNRTFPMSVLRAESIDALRQWARDRTVPA